MDARAQLDAVFLLPCFPLWGPFEKIDGLSLRLPGIHQRMLDGRPLISMLDGHQWPHSLVLCCGNTLFCTLAGTP